MRAADVVTLLWGTVRYRPYVYAFLVCFVAFATYQAGWRRMLTFALPTWAIAFLSEYSSTRNGFPFGLYTYFDGTRGRELWIANVPFWDSLSFVFLSWFSLVLAAAVRTPASARRRGAWPALRSPATALLGGVLMMLLDVVIDPVTLEGERWFLGRIYAYPTDGFYFGVTAANFAGWLVVGATSQWVFQALLAVVPWCRKRWRPVSASLPWAVLGVYGGVFAFMLAVTMAIGDYRLATASGAVSIVTVTALAWRLRGTAVHLRPAEVEAR